MIKRDLTSLVRFTVSGLLVAWLALSGCRDDSSPASGPPNMTGSTQQTATYPAAIIVADKEGSCDLGAVPAGSQHAIEFVVANPGEAPLRITRVRSDCGCISATSRPDLIAPRGSASVMALYVTPKETSPYEARLMLLTDHPERRMIVLRVTSRLPGR